MTVNGYQGLAPLVPVNKQPGECERCEEIRELIEFNTCSECIEEINDNQLFGE